jgi:solute carrier family 25 S-adenosylmethionine transporter 26
VLLGLAADPRAALAGFGAPIGAASSPPLPDSRLVEILNLDREAATRKATLVRTGDFDVLLQELNALTMLDERALAATDAELALRAAESLSETMREATTSAETSDVGAQRRRLLERRRTEAEFQEKLLRRKVVEGKLQAQSQWVVYGAALGASVLSTVVMHPVDTVKVRKQAAKATETKTNGNDTDEAQRVFEEMTGVRVPVPVPVPVQVGVGVGVEASAAASAAAAPVGAEASRAAAYASATSAASSAPTIASASIFAPLGVPLTPAGVASLYDGLLPNVVKEGPPLALYLGIYEALKTALLATDLRSSPVTCYLLAGAFGELAGSVLRVPAEAVKSTQQSDASLTLRDALEVNFATAEGRANCVGAWRAAVTRDVPFGAAQIAIFEGLKVTLAGMAHPPLDGDSFLGEAILGAIGGGVGALISAPADVVVTRLIKQQSAAEAGETRLSATEMAARIRHEGGLAAFFTGAGERVLYWAPAIGIFLTAYCRIRHALL